MGRKDDLRRQIERAERELSRLEAVPDLDAMADGTILAVVIKFPLGRSYTYVGLKTAQHWYLTGNGPDKATGEQVADWLTGEGRRILTIAEVAQIGLIRDLNPGMYKFVPVCMDSSCSCSGGAHP